MSRCRSRTRESLPRGGVWTSHAGTIRRPAAALIHSLGTKPHRSRATVIGCGPPSRAAHQAGTRSGQAAVAHKLVIVESPAKARTIGGYLGTGYVVESSIGHIRDLPQSAAETPAKIKDKPWGRLAVDVDNGFEPYYVVPRDKKQHISKLKSLLKDADELYLATDEDREGEAIAWHLLDELKPKEGIPVKRMVFHEITKAGDPRGRREPARARHGPRRGPGGAPHPRPSLRLRGQPGPVEEGHVRPVRRPRPVRRHPAGRRPRARADGVPARVVLGPRGHLRRRRRPRSRGCSRASSTRSTTSASPAAPTSAPTACSRTRRAAASTSTAPAPRRLVAGARRHDVRRSARSRPSPTDARRTRRSAPPPSSRRPAASSACRASVTMSVAQRLYENGFITYMRTDSTTLSGGAVEAARSQVRELYGAEYLPDAPRTYASKVKNAQEAHEAIRPAGETFRTPAQTGLTGEQFRLYELIWMRTVASQMKDAVGQSVSVRIGGARLRRSRRRLLGVRPGHHVPRVPQGVRRGHRRRQAQRRRPGPAARARRGRLRHRRDADAPTATRPSPRPATPRRR